MTPDRDEATAITIAVGGLACVLLWTVAVMFLCLVVIGGAAILLGWQVAHVLTLGRCPASPWRSSVDALLEVGRTDDR